MTELGSRCWAHNTVPANWVASGVGVWRVYTNKSREHQSPHELWCLGLMGMKMWEKPHTEQHQGCFPTLPTEDFVTQPLLTLTAQAPSSSHSPPPELPSCETCSLVGWRKNPAFILNPRSPTQLLPHIDKNEDCHKQQEPFNKNYYAVLDVLLNQHL